MYLRYCSAFSLTSCFLNSSESREITLPSLASWSFDFRVSRLEVSMYLLHLRAFAAADAPYLFATSAENFLTNDASAAFAATTFHN